jgi:hypothetical protein
MFVPIWLIIAIIVLIFSHIGFRLYRTITIKRVTARELSKHIDSLDMTLKFGETKLNVAFGDGKDPVIKIVK